MPSHPPDPGDRPAKPDRREGDTQDDQPASTTLSLSRLAAVGTELGLVVAVLTLGGWWLDRKWHTAPWLTISGALIAIIGGLYKFIQLGRQMARSSRD